MNTIKLGKITAPQGIRGEVRVYPYTDTPDRFSQIPAVLVKGEKRRVQKARANKNLVILKLQGVDDRNAAEALRGQMLFLDRADLWEQPEDTYFVDDITGSSVVTEDGSPVGTLKAVHSRPAQDLYEIEKPDGSTFLLPAVKEFVLTVDPENKIITVRLIEGLA